MEVTADLFRNVMGDFATGVTIVTTRCADGTPYGLTVNSFTSVSLDPVLVLVCLDRRSAKLEHFEHAGRFAVSILAADQLEDSLHFSQTGSDRASFSYLSGPLGLPLLDKSLAWLECELVDAIDGGDHQILLGKVLSADRLRSDAAPLLFFRGRYADLR